MMHKKNILTAGKKLEDASKALIMVHGRGASAADIVSLSSYLAITDYAILAPEATNHSWYPYSFLEKPSENEPWLSSSLNLLETIVNDVSGVISEENIFLLGFSQGACLTLEFVARNARKFGGIVAFTGGLIGDKIYRENYKGDFMKTAIFMGTSDPDPHVPVARVNDTAAVLEEMNANVTKRIYKNMGHTIAKEEIDLANEVVFGKG